MKSKSYSRRDCLGCEWSPVQIGSPRPFNPLNLKEKMEIQGGFPFLEKISDVGRCRKLLSRSESARLVKIL